MLTISPSSLACFFRCSQMYQWQFIEEREPDEVFIFTTLGFAIHKAIELHFKYGLSFDEICSSWKTLFISICSETKKLAFPDEKCLYECVQKGLLQIKNVKEMKKRWTKFKVLDIEKYCRIPFKNPYLEDVFLSGRIDIILGDDRTVVCLDWKSSKSKEKDIDSNLQLTFYTFFAKNLYGFELDSIYGALAYPIDCDILFTQRKVEDFQCLFRQANNMLERVVKKNFLKEPKLNSRLGDCFFCQYKKTCEQN